MPVQLRAFDALDSPRLGGPSRRRLDARSERLTVHLEANSMQGACVRQTPRGPPLRFGELRFASRLNPEPDDVACGHGDTSS